MRLGIFGGTFDPPHNGHLHLVQAAQTQLALDKVLWVVTADPPHKQGNPLSPLADRLLMVEAALAAEPTCEISRIDIDRPGPHWAADTVRLLAAQQPAAHLIYLMGGDSLRDLPTWGRPLEFLAHCTLGVLRRPQDAIDLDALEAQLPGLSAKVQFVEAEPQSIASYVIRQRVAAGESITHFVPAAVAQIIQTRKLYR